MKIPKGTGEWGRARDALFYRLQTKGFARLGKGLMNGQLAVFPEDEVNGILEELDDLGFETKLCCEFADEVAGKVIEYYSIWIREKQNG